MIYLINLALILFTFNGGINVIPFSKVNTPKGFIQTSKQGLSLEDLKFLLDNLNKEQLVSRRITSMGYHKKLEGIYISNEMVTAKKPKHWISLTDMGKSSMVSFKTTDIKSWEKLIREIKKLAKAQKLRSETSDIAEKYELNKYRLETYKPVNGININLNNLYEVIIMHNR